MENSRYYIYNGDLYTYAETPISVDNRSFRYGDGVFESMRWDGQQVLLLPFHLDRLHRSMELLQLEGKNLYDAFFIRQQIEKLIRQNALQGKARVRLSVFRNGGGLYTPETNKAGYLLEVNALIAPVRTHNNSGLIIDVYRQHAKALDDFSGLKSNNALLSVLASQYKKAQGLDDVILLNKEGNICESTSSNIFIWYEQVLYTPLLSEACVDGVMRRALIAALQEQSDIELVEARISPEILQVADEVLLTNAVHGVQPVLGYKKKRYFNRVGRHLAQCTQQWIQDTFDPEQPE